MRSEPVVIVNETFAKRTFPGQDALGREIVSSARYIGPLGTNLRAAGPFRIVGIVADVAQAPLGQPAEPVIYHTASLFPFRAMIVAARGADTATVTAAMRAARVPPAEGLKAD